MFKFVLLTLCLLLSFNSYSETRLVVEHVKKHRYKTNKSESLRTFPYKLYLKHISFNDLRTIDKDRSYLNQHGHSGNEFVYHLANAFTKHYPPQLSTLDISIQIGSDYVSKTSWLSSKDKEVFKIVGLFVLKNAANALSGYVDQELISPDDSDFKNYVSILASHKIHIPIKQTTLDKLFRSKSNPGYLFRRLVDNLIERCPICERIQILNSPDGTPGRSHSSQYVSDIRLRTFLSNGELRTFEILHNSRGSIGHMSFIPRPDYRAKYYAGGNVNHRFSNDRRNGHALTAFTGGFTNAKGKPEGLTIESGKVVNPIIMHDRDGLVVFKKDGGIIVLSLKRKQIYLPTGYRQSLKINNPADDILGYSKLLNWAKKHQGTVFQTQLLAYSDKMLINAFRASSDLRERRLLALITDKENNQVMHVVVNLPGRFTLFDSAEMLFKFFRSRSFKVEAILNLDVGAYDIYELYQGNKPRNQPKGPVNIQRATNLITYWR